VNVTKPRLVILLLLTVLHVGVSAECMSTRRFSEESSPVFCPNSFAVKSIACYGSFCDDKQLTCCRYAPGYDRSATNGWSSWFSDEGREDGTNQQYTQSGFVSGMACSGKYCDNLRLNYLRSANFSNTGACEWTSSFSEEQRSMSCPGDAFVSGLRCQGRYCDNLQLYCCQLRAR